MKKYSFIIVAVAAVLLISTLWRTGEESDQSTSNSTRISTAVIDRGYLIISVNSTGIVEPILTVDLKSKASGEIIELLIEEGDRVTPDQFIARLDDAIAQNE